MIECDDWDELVSSTYNRPYCLQQQEGCRDRGTLQIEVPNDWEDGFKDVDSIEEVVNGEEMGVSFDAWLSRDPKQKSKDEEWEDDFEITMFWERNFYPDLGFLANDLYKRGELPAGKYLIRIDW